MPFAWKYSKERLAKHPYCAHILRMKKVIYHCGKTIKLGRRYDKTFLNIHVKGKGCLAKQGVQSILNFYKPISKLEKNEKNENADDVSSAEEWESDDDDRMDDDDLFNVDEENEVQTESDIEDEYSKGLTIQNIRRLRSNSEDILTDPTLCFENSVYITGSVAKISSSNYCSSS
ncbi:unnamed protein product [Rhizophagus irregularis]|nr:unnamed protein product [Rhizophagus irregularis]